MNTVTLIGAEDVRSASRQISQAASDMKRAADIIEMSLNKHQQFMTEWLAELRSLLEDK